MRIVSLCPSLTETVFALHRGAEVVGRTRFCTHPPDGVAAIPSVGGTKNPKIEEILALRPDLVLLNEEENRREDAEALTAAGVEISTSLPRTPREAAAVIRRLGRRLDRQHPAELLAQKVEEAVHRAEEVARRRPAPVRWAYLIWRKPWMVAGGDTYIDALLTLPGGTNVFHQREERYPAITAEELGAAAPEQIFLSSEPFPFEGKHLDELAKATGLHRQRFRLVDGRLLSWHGASTPAGLRHACTLLTPGR